jgi:hypothetical protein
MVKINLKKIMEVYMITRVSKKVICIKDIPSNLIEEAIFILKTNDKQDEGSNKTVQRKRGSDLIVREAEDIVNEYVGKFQKEYDSEKRITERREYSIQQIKKNALGIIIIFAGICALISMLIN